MQQRAAGLGQQIASDGRIAATVAIHPAPCPAGLEARVKRSCTKADGMPQKESLTKHTRLAGGIPPMDTLRGRTPMLKQIKCHNLGVRRGIPMS